MENKKSETSAASPLQKFVRAVVCNILGHFMRFDTDNAAGPSTCKLCGHKEPGIKWERGPSTELFSDKMKNLNTGKIWIKANEKEARKLRKRFIPTTMMDKFDEPDNFPKRP